MELPRPAREPSGRGPHRCGPHGLRQRQPVLLAAVRVNRCRRGRDGPAWARGCAGFADLPMVVRAPGGLPSYLGDGAGCGGVGYGGHGSGPGPVPVGWAPVVAALRERVPGPAAPEAPAVLGRDRDPEAPGVATPRGVWSSNDPFSSVSFQGSRPRAYG